MWIAVGGCFLLVRRSQTRPLRDPPPDSVLGERSCVNQQIPPEILNLLLDGWDTRERERNAITLTHVCRAWRQIFTSRPSLRTDLGYLNANKTRVYLEHLEPSPVNLSLDTDKGLSPYNLFFQIASPHCRTTQIPVHLEHAG